MADRSTRLDAVHEARLELARAPLQKSPVSLDKLVESVRQELMRQTPADRREIDWHLESLPAVEADPALMRQVLVNLPSNALKYSSRRDRARVEIGLADGAPEETVIFVRDNGAGFDAQYIGKLFGVFQRLHGADEFEGTGIGLANVKRIVSRHGGRVWAESVLDQGATFYVALPRSR